MPGCSAAYARVGALAAAALLAARLAQPLGLSTALAGVGLRPGPGARAGCTTAPAVGALHAAGVLGPCISGLPFLPAGALAGTPVPDVAHGGSGAVLLVVPYPEGRAAEPPPLPSWQRAEVVVAPSAAGAAVLLEPAAAALADAECDAPVAEAVAVAGGRAPALGWWRAATAASTPISEWAAQRLAVGASSAVGGAQGGGG